MARMKRGMVLRICGDIRGGTLWAYVSGLLRRRSVDGGSMG